MCGVVICFQISIFEPLETTPGLTGSSSRRLWFAFKLVSLNHWKQQRGGINYDSCVVICFQISIFEPLETTGGSAASTAGGLWFAFKLVSLNHWKQQETKGINRSIVVICFQISIFEPLETTILDENEPLTELWFAFKLVSLNHWKQHKPALDGIGYVVICFQISIFEPLETTLKAYFQQKSSCDLLSN